MHHHKFPIVFIIIQVNDVHDKIQALLRGEIEVDEGDDSKINDVRYLIIPLFVAGIYMFILYIGCIII